ncbi:TPA: DUF624 domain-containing protein [Streptococcus suis]
MHKQVQTAWKSLFDVEHPVWQLAEKVWTVLVLNLLFVLTALPIVTFGIAQISLVASLNQLRLEGKIAAVKTFTSHAKTKWKQGLLLGGVDLALLFFSLGDFYLVRDMQAPVFEVFKVICVAVFVFSRLLFLYAYPLAVEMNRSLKEILVHAGLLVGVRLSLTLLVVLVQVVLVLLALWSGFSLLLVLSLLATIGYAGLLYLFLLALHKK